MTKVMSEGLRVNFMPFQGSHRNSKPQFHEFSMIFHDQQCNFHEYLMHSLQPPLYQHLHNDELKCGMQQQQPACRPCMPLEIIKI